LYSHWYVSELPFERWLLDMKLEAMVPSLVDLLRSARHDKRMTIDLRHTADIHTAKRAHEQRSRNSSRRHTVLSGTLNGVKTSTNL
jgi:hypothetical protein